MLENLKDLKWIYDEEIPTDMCEKFRQCINDLDWRNTLTKESYEYTHKDFKHLKEIHCLYENYYELKLRETPLDEVEVEEEEMEEG